MSGGKYKTLPGILRILLLVLQTAAWITMAAALQNNSINFSLSNIALTNVLIVRVVFLVIFVVGSVISLVVLAFGFFDRSLGPVAILVVLDFIWALGQCIISVFAALVEGYMAGQNTPNNTFYSRINYYNWWYIFVVNKGAFAVAAVSFFNYFHIMIQFSVLLKIIHLNSRHLVLLQQF